MEMKTCGKCKQEYPKTDEYFYRRERGYFKSECKSCNIKMNLSWTQNNPEKSREKTARWRKNNPEKVKISNKKSRTKRIDKVRIERRAWENGPGREYKKMQRRIRRARKNNVISEPYTEQQILDKYGHNCYLCQEPIDFTVARTEPKGFQVEHVTAISKGGPDTLENVRPSHAACNWSKGNKALQDLASHNGSQSI